MRASNGEFLSFDTNTSIFTINDYVGTTETFLLYQDDSSGAIALQASNGNFISIVNGGGDDLIINAPVIKTWETLKLIDMGNHNIALQALGGQYIGFSEVNIDANTSQSQVKAVAIKITASETFSLYNIDMFSIIYSDTEYNGAYQVLTDSKYDIPDLIIGSKQLSSIKVPEGDQVVIYSDSNFSGTFKILPQMLLMLVMILMIRPHHF